ncbi:hypothetical protein HAX54_029596 [Datura stramonium]|uniref:Uncharacterized protein n=1 Tax=Datura stramonium TaxID=4076 RepID=A0ABS8V764_DATST|nr:hypothetical protein [Datura stramonium]
MAEDLGRGLAESGGGRPRLTSSKFCPNVRFYVDTSIMKELGKNFMELRLLIINVVHNIPIRGTLLGASHIFQDHVDVVRPSKPFQSRAMQALEGAEEKKKLRI